MVGGHAGPDLSPSLLEGLPGLLEELLFREVFEGVLHDIENLLSKSSFKMEDSWGGIIDIEKVGRCEMDRG
jgi:hypothetical protein